VRATEAERRWHGRCESVLRGLLRCPHSLHGRRRQKPEVPVMLSIHQVRTHLLPLMLLTALSAGACVAPVEEADDDPIASTEQSLSSCLPEIPEALAVPDGNKLAFVLGAEGVQIYDCKAAADGTASWVFRAPEADLFGHRGRIAGSHYVGPTWEALDGSTVVGARVAGVSVDASAIPWLLLQAASHTGKGRMSKVTFIQRVNTGGGLAPAGSCELGAVAEVDYTADYLFYTAKPQRGVP
jgi:Protein of unknown function (DUF3455)